MKLTDIPPGSGKTGTLDGRSVAVYNDAGTPVVFENVCSHAACEVEWNETEKVWDCPCHGSRFTPQGEVIVPPAQEPLPKLQARLEGDEIVL